MVWPGITAMVAAVKVFSLADTRKTTTNPSTVKRVSHCHKGQGNRRPSIPVIERGQDQ